MKSKESSVIREFAKMIIDTSYPWNWQESSVGVGERDGQMSWIHEMIV